MILPDIINHWPTIVNIIVNTFFSELTTICVLHHKDYDLPWTSAVNFNVFLHINPMTLNESFASDVYNYKSQDDRLISNVLFYNDWIKKFVAAIDNTFCEGFVIFQEDIPKFAATFRLASLYSKWRSIYNRFLFIYAREDQQDDYFQDIFFKNFANILVVEADFKNSSAFSIKTTKFVGSLYKNPHKLIQLSEFDAVHRTFEPLIDLYALDKFQDLQGREIIAGAFDYRPFVAVDFGRLPQYYDHAEDNPTHLAHVDGTEMHVVHTFCELYNCTVQVDTSEKVEWGSVYPNYTGYGLMGLILDGKTHMAMDAMYAWDIPSTALDLTTFLGRSGVVCLVPAPTRITSWTLPIRPFQFTLWLGIFGCLVLEAVSLLIARYFEQTVVDEVQDEGASNWWHSLQFGYIITLKLFVSQGSDYAVNSHTVRTVLFACYMIDIIITSIYGGGLAAILTLPTLTEAADSVDRLYSHNIAWAASSYDWIFSLTPKDGEENDPVFKRLLSNYRVYSMDELREKALTDNMGFVLERLLYGHFGNGDFITPEALDRLKLMTDDIYYQFTVAMVPRLWAHLPKFNDLVLLWHSSGFSKFWEWKIAADYMNVNEQDQVEASRYTNFDMGPVKLDMNNFAGLAMLWFVGIGVSILIYAGEWFVYWLLNKREHQRGTRKAVRTRQIEIQWT